MFLILEWFCTKRRCVTYFSFLHHSITKTTARTKKRGPNTTLVPCDPLAACCSLPSLDNVLVYQNYKHKTSGTRIPESLSLGGVGFKSGGGAALPTAPLCLTRRARASRVIDASRRASSYRVIIITHNHGGGVYLELCEFFRIRSRINRCRRRQRYLTFLSLYYAHYTPCVLVTLCIW